MNPKNSSSNYLKYESQTLWARNAAHTNKNEAVPQEVRIAHPTYADNRPRLIPSCRDAGAQKSSLFILVHVTCALDELPMLLLFPSLMSSPDGHTRHPRLHPNRCFLSEGQGRTGKWKGRVRQKTTMTAQYTNTYVFKMRNP